MSEFAYISYIEMHLENKMLIWQNRVFNKKNFWKFIEVKGLWKQFNDFHQSNCFLANQNK
jgi:hypothetical protein